MNYDQQKYERDNKTLSRVKSKLNAYNSILNPSGSQKLKIMALIQHRIELKNKLARKQVA